MRKLANLYTCYKYRYDRNIRKHVKVELPDRCLFSCGQFKTKIRAEDLPDWYVYGYFYKVHGYMSAKGIKHMVYHPQKHWDHMFKDDCLYISYNTPIIHNEESIFKYEGYDERMYGGIIVQFLLAAEKYSGYDISEIKAQIEDKRLWFKATFPEMYKLEVPDDKPFFE